MCFVGRLRERAVETSRRGGTEPQLPGDRTKGTRVGALARQALHASLGRFEQAGEVGRGEAERHPHVNGCSPRADGGGGAASRSGEPEGRGRRVCESPRGDGSVGRPELDEGGEVLRADAREVGRHARDALTRALTEQPPAEQIGQDAPIVGGVVREPVALLLPQHIEERARQVGLVADRDEARRVEARSERESLAESDPCHPRERARVAPRREAQQVKVRVCDREGGKPTWRSDGDERSRRDPPHAGGPSDDPAVVEAHRDVIPERLARPGASDHDVPVDAERLELREIDSTRAC